MNHTPRPSEPQAGETRAASGFKPDLSIVAFVLSLCFVVFVYGVAVQRYKIFPYSVIEQASDAWRALRNRDDDTLMNGAEPRETSTPRPTITTLSPAAGAEAVLVTGGPYQNLERCPRYGCFAWVMDRKGRIIHSWEVDLKALTADLTGFAPGFAPGDAPQNIYPIGVAITPDGGLVATLHGRNLFPYEVGVVRIDRDGRILWKRFDNSNHFFSLDGQGRIYTPATTIKEDLTHFGRTAVDTLCDGDKVYDDSIRVYSPDGVIEREFWMQDVFQKAGYPGLFYGLRHGCDPFHVNSVAPASAAAASHLEGVEAGDLLVSVREPSTIAVLDGQTGALKRIVTGRTAAQHSAVFLADGTVLVFDNRGGDRELGGTRVARVNLDTGETETVYPRSKAQLANGPFYADERGRLDVSADGSRALVASGEESDITEIDLATGEPLWLMHKSFDISAYPKLTGKKTDVKAADFVAYGAYYVNDVSMFTGKP